MKKITLLMAFAFIGLTALAQVSEDFEDGIPEGWSTVVNAGDCDWALDTGAGGVSGLTGNGMFFDDDACGNGAPASNASLVSAVYDLSFNTSAVTLGYDVVYDELGGSTLLVEYYDGAEWIEVITYTADVDPFITESFDLGTLTNADAQVRFTYDDADGAWAWSAGIDNVTLDFTLSTDSNSISGFKMFPNPANSELNLSASRNIENVAVFNMLGQKVLEQQIGANSQAINVSNLKTGAYLMQVTADGQTGTYKFVKQ